jgi:hypothetical protein
MLHLQSVARQTEQSCLCSRKTSLKKANIQDGGVDNKLYIR